MGRGAHGRGWRNLFPHPPPPPVLAFLSSAAVNIHLCILGLCLAARLRRTTQTLPTARGILCISGPQKYVSEYVLKYDWGTTTRGVEPATPNVCGNPPPGGLIPRRCHVTVIVVQHDGRLDVVVQNCASARVLRFIGSCERDGYSYG